MSFIICYNSRSAFSGLTHPYPSATSASPSAAACSPSASAVCGPEDLPPPVSPRTGSRRTSPEDFPDGCLLSNSFWWCIGCAARQSNKGLHGRPSPAESFRNIIDIHSPIAPNSSKPIFDPRSYASQVSDLPAQRLKIWKLEKELSEEPTNGFSE